MNIEIASVYPKSWKIVKSRAFAVITAGAIAAAALIGVVGLDGKATPAATGSAEAPGYVFVPGSVDPAQLEGFLTRPTMSFFLVGSEEQHDLVVAEQRQIAAERDASGGRKHLFEVAVANTPQGETDAWDLLGDLKVGWMLRDATNLEVIDLRAE
jgi:hypothetical protein